MEKNDLLNSTISINVNSKYFLILTVKNSEYRCLAINIKEVPELEKGSGVILFKSKNSTLYTLAILDEKLQLLDNFSRRIYPKVNFTKFISSRAKQGKIIKIDNNVNNFFRGYDSNFKLV